MRAGVRARMACISSGRSTTPCAFRSSLSGTSRFIKCLRGSLCPMAVLLPEAKGLIAIQRSVLLDTLLSVGEKPVELAGVEIAMALLLNERHDSGGDNIFGAGVLARRSEEHTSELQSRGH